MAVIGGEHADATTSWRSDTGTLIDWVRVAERSPFVLSEQGVLVRRSPLRAQTPSH